MSFVWYQQLIRIKYASVTVSYAKELRSVSMCYLQGGGFNTPPCLVYSNCTVPRASSSQLFVVHWLCYVAFSVVPSCAIQDDVSKDYVCTLTTSPGISRPPYPDHLAYAQRFEATQHA